MNKLMNKVRKNKKGFTLIELIVVMAILGILVLLAAPRFLNYTKQAEVTTMQADAKVLSNAALVYNTENEGKWPVEDDDAAIEIDGKSVTVATLKEEALKDHVQTLKNDIEDYKLVTKDSEELGLKEGDIIYVGNEGAGVKDRNGNTHYGVNLEIEKGE